MVGYEKKWCFLVLRANLFVGEEWLSLLTLLRQVYKGNNIL